MMSQAALLLVATFSMAVLTHAHPLSESSSAPETAHAPSSKTPAHNPRLQKRTASKDLTAEELAALKDLILTQVASELTENLRGGDRPIPSALSKRAKEEDEREKEVAALLADPKGDTMMNEMPAILKRQIRYHQCYFNPISCFRRK